jgi:DNA-binding MarR family transcriptional regulator
VRTAARAAARSDAVVRAAGLSPSQYNVLRILRHAGEPGLSRVGIAERMVAREPDLTRILSGLTRLRAVQTRQSRVDRRSRVSVITERGLTILDQLDAAVREAAIVSLGGLGPSRLRELERLLAGIGDSVSE